MSFLNDNIGNNSSSHNAEESDIQTSSPASDDGIAESDEGLNVDASHHKETNSGELLPQLNNVGGVTPELLYFGADYLVLNLLALVHETDTKSLGFIGLLFGTEDDEITWADSELKLIKTLSEKRKGIRTLYFKLGRHNLFAIEEVCEDSLLKLNLGYKYDYRLSFYGAFFCAVRLGLVILDDVFGLIREDIRHSRVLHSISRLDVCADIWHVETVDVLHGVEILSPDKAKKFSFFSADKSLSQVETIYYGTTPVDWQARIYNKSLEITKEDKKRNKPSKEDLFPDYFDYSPPITRVEVEMRGACREYEIDLEQSLDIEVQLGLFLKKLDGKYCKWAIAEFVCLAMRDRGFGPWEVKNRKLTKDRLSNMPALWQYRSRGVNLAERVSLGLEELNTICEELTHIKPPPEVQYAGCE
ncbi:MAG: hypothetical protein ABIA92_01340 [Patescibacteria group bacterium]